MTLKKYLKPWEAAEYLTEKIGAKTTAEDVGDLCATEQLLVVFYYKGFIRERLHKLPSLYTFDGYLGSYKVWKMAHNGRYTKFGLNIVFYDDYPSDLDPATSTGKNYELAIGYKDRFVPNDLRIPRAELDALIARHQAAPVAASEPTPQDTKAQRPPDIEEGPITGNIDRRNQIKKDLQGMARTLATHWWKNDTAQTLLGDMADKVYREVAKFAPDGFMPEKVTTVADWIRPIAPEYARKAGRPKTP